MSAKTELLPKIPKVDDLLVDPRLARGDAPHTLVMDAVRDCLDGLRGGILRGELSELPEMGELVGRVNGGIAARSAASLRRVVNATGIVLHTNLGRAPLCEEAVRAACDAAAGYSTLEYDVESGGRGSRYAHVEQLLCKLTGAESALAVNNNAAAVMLILDTMAKGKEVLISRGELVEIGGSFRVPEIMEQSGGILREVGTTNKTHLADYERAISPERTGALLKVHTSNFKIVGFTDEVSLGDLARLGRERGLPCIYDLGSGALYPMGPRGIPGEPCVTECVATGADVVCFSGDKLLGGPQAGVILGKRDVISRMKKNPLTRALRVDKMTLAALEATLRVYLDPERAAAHIPTLGMLYAKQEELKTRAETLCEQLRDVSPDCVLCVTETEGQVGGGSVPGQMLPSWAVAAEAPGIAPLELERRMRHADMPVIGRVFKDRLLLDVRTIADAEFEAVAGALANAVRESIVLDKKN